MSQLKLISHFGCLFIIGINSLISELAKSLVCIFGFLDFLFLNIKLREVLQIKEHNICARCPLSTSAASDLGLFGQVLRKECLNNNEPSSRNDDLVVADEVSASSEVSRRQSNLLELSRLEHFVGLLLAIVLFIDDLVLFVLEFVGICEFLKLFIVFEEQNDGSIKFKILAVHFIDQTAIIFTGVFDDLNTLHCVENLFGITRVN